MFKKMVKVSDLIEKYGDGMSLIINSNGEHSKDSYITKELANRFIMWFKEQER